MTTQLRDELARLGDAAPPLHVDPGTWGRGRRARRRDRVVTAVTALVLVGSIGGAGLALTQDASTPDRSASATSDATPGVPGVVVLPPNELVATGDEPARWDDEVASQDLALGTGAVALEVPGPDTEDSAALLVTADGRHHALDLPGWQGEDSALAKFSPSRLLALSHDGTHLAWAWRDDSGHGVQVADLRTGDVRPFAFGPGDADVVEHLSWSPDGRWLAWRGALVDSDPTGGVGGRLSGGRISLETGEVETVPVTTGATSIDSDGRTVASSGGTAALSPDGSTVLVASDVPRSFARFVDRATGKGTRRPLGKDLDLYPEGAEVHPLGWIDDSLAVALVMPAGDTTVDDEAQLVLMTSPSVPEEQWTYRIVGHVDTSEASAFAPASLSIATDLMTLDEPTVATERPDWPGAGWWQRLPWGWTLLLVAGAAAAYLLVSRRRLA